jgi:hypothetical protein
VKLISPDLVCTLCRVADNLVAVITQPFLAAVAETCASISFCEHSSQQTSTVLPPIVTLMAFSSSSQSQAAQVFSTIASLSYPEVRVPPVGHAGREERCQNL